MYKRLKANRLKPYPFLPSAKGSTAYPHISTPPAINPPFYNPIIKMKSSTLTLLSALLVTGITAAPLQTRSDDFEAVLTVESGAWLKERETSVIEARNEEGDLDALITLSGNGAWLKERDSSTIKSRTEEGNLDALITLSGNGAWLKERDTVTLKARDEESDLDVLITLSGNGAWLKE